MANYKISLGLNDNVTPKLNIMDKSIAKVGQTVASLGKTLVAGFAVKSVIDGVKSLIESYEVQEKAVKRVNEALYSQGKAMGLTQEQIDSNVYAYEDQASALQKVGIYGDEFTMQGMAMATQMGLTANQVQQMTPVLLDMMATTKGTSATVEDLTTANQAFAQFVTQGTTKAFKQFKLELTDTEKEQIKNMSATERYNFLLEKMSKTYLGGNAKALETVGGKMAQLDNYVGDLKESLGGVIVSALFPLLNNILPPLINELDFAIKLLSGDENAKSEFWDSVGNAIETVCTFAKRLAPLLIPLIPLTLQILFNFISMGVASLWASITSGVGAVVGAVKNLWLLVTANPMLFAIMAIVTALVWCYTNWDLVTEYAGKAWDLCVQFGDWISGVFSRAWEGMKEFAVKAFNSIVETVKWAWDHSPLGMVVNALVGLAGKTVTLITENRNGTQEHNALGTSYFKGGLTHINERNAGEIVNLPNGSQIIPHDVAVKQSNAPVYNVNVTVQGNVIGNEEYVNDIGNSIVQKLQLSMSNI